MKDTTVVVIGGGRSYRTPFDGRSEATWWNAAISWCALRSVAVLDGRGGGVDLLSFFSLTEAGSRPATSRGAGGRKASALAAAYAGCGASQLSGSFCILTALDRAEQIPSWQRYPKS